MKTIWVILLVWSVPLFGQKPPIDQKNYIWNQDFNAVISDKGSIVLTQSIYGLYIYNTSLGKSTYYSKAFNGKISSDEQVIAFQKENDTLVILYGKREVNIDSVAGFLLLSSSNSIIIQKVDGSLYYYQDYKIRPIVLQAVNKYIVDKRGSKVYYSTNDGVLACYSFGNSHIDTVFKAKEIGNFQVDDITKEIVVQAKVPDNDIIVIKGNKTQVSLRKLLDEQLAISDRDIQLEQATGKVYFRSVSRKVVSDVDTSVKYSGMQVWNYMDPYLYPVLVRREVDSSHYCIYDPKKDSVFDFGSFEVTYLPIDPAIENKYIIGLTPINIFEKYWQKSGRASCILINTNTGKVKEVFHEMDGYSSMFSQLQLDPKQQYLLYYDLTLRNYRAYNIALGTEILLGKGAKLVLDNIDEDPSSTPIHYGVAGWSADGRFVYVYDKYDIWKLDMEGIHSPKCVTQGVGSRTKRKFRIADARENIRIKEDEDLLISCFDYGTRDNGFYELNIKKNSIRELIMDAHIYYNPGGSSPGWAPVRSRNKKYWLFERMSVSEHPNYYITEDFENIKAVTDYQPQAAYNWMSSRLVKIGDGDTAIEGLLYVPENFDAGKKYPIIFNLYEKFTEGKNQYLFPKLSNGLLNIPWYVSNGYLVFCPDVKYRINEPGESVLRTAMIARNYFAGQSFIDSMAIGLQGHSFGGYEVNYIVTHYGGFTAACTVSGASNLLMSFGNIRNAGNSGQNMFEKGQYRIRKPLWDAPEIFLKNSPVANTNKVTTPLLLVSNKGDSTVLWSHAVEMFTALRRMGKICWLLQYDHSKHAIYDVDELDFSIRMQQYFDFYLKHRPQPDWMKVETNVRERSRFPEMTN